MTVEQQPSPYQKVMDSIPTSGMDRFLELIGEPSESEADAKLQMQVAVLKTMSTRQAAQFLGVSHSTVARIRAEMGVARISGKDGRERLTHNPPALRQARDARIIELFREGQSTRAIAADARCSVGTVHRVIKAHKIAVVKRAIDRNHEAMGGSASTGQIYDAVDMDLASLYVPSMEADQ